MHPTDSPLMLLVATALISSLTSPTFGQQADPPPAAEAAATESQPPSEAIVIPDEPRTIDPAQFVPEPLGKPVTVEFKDATLKDVVQWLTEKQGIAVQLDERTLHNAGVLPSDPVSDQLDEEPLYLLLDHLQSMKLDWYFEAGVLHLTTPAVVEERMVTKPYNVGNLLDVEYDSDTLIQLILSVASGRWMETDGKGGTIQGIGDVVFVRQTERVHREISGLFAALAQPARMTLVDDPPQNILLREQLDSMLSVDFVEVPLAEAIARIARDSGADIRLDVPGLRAKRLHEREPVSLTLPDRDLRTVLNALLANLNLRFQIQDGIILVTADESNSKADQVAVYDVRDLCRDHNESLALLDAVQNQTTGPWFDLDGIGGEIDDPKPGVLVVRQSESVLQEILRLLEAYRAALRVSKPRAEEEHHGDEIITRYYRMHQKMADDLAVLLPQLVAAETWQVNQAVGAKGTIVEVSSQPNGADPQSVLIITQSRSVQESIADTVKRISQGDAVEAEFSGGGFCGGGFGGGFFSVEKLDSER